jgi:uncharacterized protein (TIGR03085 family)
MTSYADRERAALADLFERLGPDEPTLCEGWDTRRLAAHLVLRERRPDAALGIMVRPLRGYADKVHAEIAARPWTELVTEFRNGPPAWSPANLPGADDYANTVEFFVHSEDARRAQTGWSSRTLDPGLDELLWKRLRATARLLYRRARVGVVLRRADSGEEIRAREGTPTVTVTGPAPELLLHGFGRTRHSRVVIDGDPEAVRIFATTPLNA